MDPIDYSNPWFNTLMQKIGKCKIRGDFRGTFAEPCDFKQIYFGTDLINEAYASHLMKAITSCVYAIREIGADGNYVKVYNRSDVKNHYETYLNIEIPSALENIPKDGRPFTEAGNGRVGYTIYNIKYVSGFPSPRWLPIWKTGYGMSDSLGRQQELYAFYRDSSNSPTTKITSAKEECNRETPIISQPDTTSESSPINSVGAVVAIAIISTILVILIVILLLIYLKKSE